MCFPQYFLHAVGIMLASAGGDRLMYQLMVACTVMLCNGYFWHGSQIDTQHFTNFPKNLDEIDGEFYGLSCLYCNACRI